MRQPGRRGVALLTAIFKILLLRITRRAKCTRTSYGTGRLRMRLGRVDCGLKGLRVPLRKSGRGSVRTDVQCRAVKKK